jgi:sulfate permease, SulP family
MAAWAPPIERWLPLVGTVRRYGAEAARRDAVAALTVALFTIPQAMAYALIAGMPPAAGIWAAVAASILGAAFGSSEFLVDGPTNAMSVLLAANFALFASGGDPVAMIVVVTLLMGALQLAAAALRLGGFARFVSEPVLTGFTAGAGIYIAVNQLPPLLGLDRALLPRTVGGFALPANCVFDLLRALAGAGRTNLVALGVGAGTFAAVRALQWGERRLERRLPAPFLAVAGFTALAFVLGLGEPEAGPGKLMLVRDIAPLRRSLPALAWPDFTLADLKAVLGPALAIGTLGSVEAIAIGKTLAARVGHVFDANRQLVGEGLCNVGAALVGGFASSGSFTRSAVNFESGALTRLSAVFSALLIVAILLLFAPVANYVPVACLAGTLIHVGLKLVNVGKLRLTLQTTVGDRMVLLTTFLGVLLVEHLQYALFAGIAMAIYQALRRAEGFKLTVLEEDAAGHLFERPLVPADRAEVLVVALQGELFFAAAEVLDRRLRELLGNGTRFVVLHLTHAYNLDSTCAETIAQVARDARARGGRLILAGVRAGLHGTLERAGVLRELGEEAVFLHEDQVLASTRKALASARRLALCERTAGTGGEGI